ncbi:MAG: glycosyltransferase [Myxococcota bacterium]
MIDPWLYEPAALARLPCKTMAYLIDVHRTLDVRLMFARYVDSVFVAQLEYLPYFERLPHPSVTWLPLACDPSVHFVPGLDRAYDVGFVGKLGEPGTVRHQTLSRVLTQFQSNDTSKYYLPEEMGRVYSSSKIVVNCSIGGDLNMRFFEALASGALVVTDRIGNGLDVVGRAGEHFVTYRTPEDAVEQIGKYLADDQGRQRIAMRGQSLAISTETYRHRLSEMLEVALSSTGVAPARTASRRQERLWRSRWYRAKGVKPIEALRFIARGVGPKDLVSIAVGIARHVRNS